ncbi:hypothetical protein [Azohydromonas lata]|uniref:Uncharacterized protein n=1 Tax=Azohydromonas lata TaxID=45677 RepID=A0ABU5ICX7_9BURK|nr:hypothetical protein [Azohydromonas lata]MDZ5456970.1 hypothetical protein [Azohydromonas lata]
MNNLSLAPWASRALGALAGLTGVGLTAVGGKLMVMAMQQTERDAEAQAWLASAGVLLAAGQFLAFWIAAQLPLDQMRRMRWGLVALGVLLVGAEIGSGTYTQLALAQASDATAMAQASEISQLQRTIDGRSATAATWRANCAGNSSSSIKASRDAGAEACAKAEAIEAGIEPLAARLVALQAAQRPTASTVQGEHVLVVALIRSALIAITALVMTSAGGALWRAARRERSAALPFEPMAVPVERPTMAPPAPVRLASGPHPVPGRFSTAAAAFPAAVVTAAVPGFAHAVPPVPVVVRAEQRVPEQAPAPVPPVPAPEQAAASAPMPVPAPAAAPEAAPVPVPAPEQRVVCLQAPETAGCGIEPDEQPEVVQTGLEASMRDYYMRVLQGVRAGTIQPNVRSVRAAVGGATATVQRCLGELHRAGVIEPRNKGRGYQLTQNGGC